MNRLALIVVSLMATGLGARSEAVDALAPPAVTPKEVERPYVPRTPYERPKSPRPDPDGDKPIIADKPNLTITGIIIVKTRAEVQESVPPTATGLQVRDIPFLNHPDFNRTIEPFLGQLLTKNMIRDLEDEIILYLRDR